MTTTGDHTYPLRQPLRGLGWVVCAGLTLLVGNHRAWAVDWYGARVEVPLFETPYELALGDMNGDGIADCALGTAQGTAEHLTIYLNDGVGNFSAGVVLPVTNPWRAIVVGDFNGDGRDDIAYGDNPLKVIYADPDFTYSATPVVVQFIGETGAPRLLLAEDLDLDGYVDLIGGHGKGSGLRWDRVYIWWGGATGLGVPVVREFNLFRDNPKCSGITEAGFVDVVDVDGDAYKDIVVAGDMDGDMWECGWRKGSGWFKNHGARNIDEEYQWIAVEDPGHYAGVDVPFFGDLNEDGAPDYLVTDTDENSVVKLFEAYATGSWAESGIVPTVLFYVWPRTPNDLNGDEHLDLFLYQDNKFEVQEGFGTSEFVTRQTALARQREVRFANVNGQFGIDVVALDDVNSKLVMLPFIGPISAAVDPAREVKAAICVVPSVGHGVFRITGVLFEAFATARPEFDVFDLSGSRVRSLAAEGQGTKWSASWDSRDDRGRLVPSGTYWVTPRGPQATAQRIIVLQTH